MIEILVVVLIGSIVMVVLISVLGSSFEILRTGETRAQLNSNARIALEYICDDIASATGIPLSFDRDLNGYPDEDVNYGYDEEAYWRVADWDADNLPIMNTSFWFSEAWSDRLLTSHTSTVIVDGQNVQNRSYTIPKVLRSYTGDSVVDYSSLIRLAIPADNQMPYYLAGEWDRNSDGVLDGFDLRNTGSANPLAVNDGLGEIQGYPSLVAVGPYKETAALIQDLFGYPRGEGSVVRVRQIPIASNITGIRFEYYHEVPVYTSRVSGNEVEIACQNVTDGTVDFVPANWELDGNMTDMEPLVSHWEQRIIDVAYNSDIDDPVNDTTYPGIHWQLQDQYPEGLEPDKRDGTHVVPNTITGLGDAIPGGWGMSVFYTSGEDGENAPVDRLAYVSTSISGGAATEGGVAQMRPDMDAIRGSLYYNYSVNPTGIGDFGDADGIPDGDGIPDDPVPGWWLPYLRTVRVTIIATPRQVIEERRARSGQTGQSGTAVYYRLDSPVPYADPNRLQAMYNLKQDYIGSGQDVIISKVVPVDFVYRTELATDPHSEVPGNRRRVEHNYFKGARVMYTDPSNPDESIRASDPIEKLREKNPL